MHRKTAVSLLLMLATALVVAACGSSNNEEKTTTHTEASGIVVNNASEIKLAPAFSESELAATPAANWITPSGGTTGDRYSSLKGINTSNVSKLKGDWMTELNHSGAANKYSQEASPVVYEGVIYIPTGADDIFAVSAATGKILWENKGNQPASLASVICCGWDNRGVAIGDGMVYSVLLSAEVEAINQKTGKTVWKKKLESPEQGYTATMAPLYANGMVFAGPVGAEFGVRGFMEAFDAKTGAVKWKHYNIPGPGEEGHESWPSNNEEWKHGGATTWNTPTVDPELGLIYYSTSNAGDDNDGRDRKGENLFASSIIALEMKTGKMKWYYQQVHHDIWDYDSTSPTVLENVEVNGQMVKGITQPSKTGYVYFLNRETGKPVFPIPEKPVPQKAMDNTWPTQPIPTMPPFSPVHVTSHQRQLLQEAVEASTPSGQKAPTVVAGESFTPWGIEGENKIQSSSNDNIGGDNWPPSSFDPSDGYYFVCSQSGATSFSVPVKHVKWKAAETYAGTAPVAGFLGFDTPGLLTAYDLHTGKIVWQKHFPKESCYSGAVSTAGGLVFVGRNNGELVAYNVENGEKLWSFQTGAGANAPVALYENGGEEHVVEIAGGNALAGSSHGANLWQWSLSGTKGPVEAGSAAKAIQHAGTAGPGEEEAAHETEEEAGEEEKQTSNAAMIAQGKTLFEEDCASCHGASGTGGNGGPNLNTQPRAQSIKGVVEQLTSPAGAMPSFNEQLSTHEKEALAQYVTHEITHSVH